MTKRDAAGIATILGAGALLLLPALIHGIYLGPYDLLQFGLTVPTHKLPVRIWDNSDLANSLIPWSALDWQEVHHGHLPIWNPYGGYGMPLAANWQSAPYSLGNLLGYLFPLRWSFDVSIITNVVCAGTGGYFLGRMLGLGAAGAATVGTVLELSGPFAAWLGYPFASVLSFGPWIMGFGLLVINASKLRRGAFFGLTLSVAFAILGGQPEGAVSLGLSIIVFFAVVILGRSKHAGETSVARSVSLARLAVGAMAGFALSLPFSLPALAMTGQSVRSSSSPNHALAFHNLAYFLIQGYDGLPVSTGGRPPTRQTLFGATFFYSETAAYLGVIVVALAVLALIDRFELSEIKAFGSVVLICLLLVFAKPAVWLMGKVPFIGNVNWIRSLLPLSLAVAALAGVGVDTLVRARDTRQSGVRLIAASGFLGCVLAGLFIFGSGTLSKSQRSVRNHSFIWPAVEVLIGLTAGYILWRPPRLLRGGRSKWLGPGSGLVLMGSAAAYLIASGAPMVQSSPRWFPQNPSILQLRSIVGGEIIGFGATFCGLSGNVFGNQPIQTVGIEPNVNDVYTVHELDIYDPIIPQWYFNDFTKLTGQASGFFGLNEFCPVVSSVKVAREAGIEYILEPQGVTGPPGTMKIADLMGEGLYQVPGTGEAVLVPLDAAPDAPGTVIAVDHPGPNTWHLELSTGPAALLRLHLSNLPGWHATINGHPWPLKPYQGMMLQTEIPPGSHNVVVDLSYWPNSLTIGLVLSGVTLLALLMVLISGQRARRRLNYKSSQPPSALLTTRPGFTKVDPLVTNLGT